MFFLRVEFLGRFEEKCWGVLFVDIVPSSAVPVNLLSFNSL